MSPLAMMYGRTTALHEGRGAELSYRDRGTHQSELRGVLPFQKPRAAQLRFIPSHAVTCHRLGRLD
jgi:hypothetical protein